MKKRIVISFAAFVVIAGAVYLLRSYIAAWFVPGRSAPAASTGGDHSGHAPAAPGSNERKILYWVDPMHPAYKSDRPGIAPDCGMTLVPVYADEAAQLAPMPPGTVRITPERQQLIGVKLGQVERQAVRKTIRAVARISYDETKIVHYHNKVEGWIEEIFANYTGAPIHVGDPLFSLYSPELVSTQQEYLIALRAKKELSESPVPEIARSTESLLQAARQRLKLWDVSDDQIRRLEETREPQRTITFYSPHHGFILEKKAFEHLRVTLDTDLYMFADLSTVWAIVEIYEYEASLVQVGQRATLSLPTYPGQTFAGRISYIYPQFDPQTRTLKVRMDFPNPGLKLRPDMFATAEIIANLGAQLVIPADAVLDSGTQRYVFLAKGDGYFEPREVTLGPRSDGYFLVQSGLKAGDTVVTSANFLIDSESRLKQATAQMGSQHQQ